MKKLLSSLACLLLLQSCYFSRPCPIKNCHVSMEHQHSGRTFSPHGLFNLKFHYLGEKLFKKNKAKPPEGA